MAPKYREIEVEQKPDDMKMARKKFREAAMRHYAISDQQARPLAR